MKKNVLLSVFVLLLVVFLVSCGGGPVQGNQMAVVVTNWNAGPVVTDATVTVFENGTDKLIGNGVTNENGAALIVLFEMPEKIDILVTKQEHARSLIVGLKTTLAINNFFPVILQTANNEEDPTKETDPNVEVDLASEEASERLTEEPITGPFQVTVNVEADRDVMVIYEPLLDRIPGSASVTSNVGEVRFADTATFEISPTGFDGEIPLYTTVYDDNNNRVVKINYLQIEGTDPGEVQMYQPMTFVDFTEHVADYVAENIRSYTRRDGINLRNEGRTAPAETNLWTHLYWADWTSLNDYYGPGSLLPDPGEKPDGYNLYRSGDGKTYQKFAFISESSVGGVAETICEEMDRSNVDRIVNSNPMGIDGSFYVFPEFSIYYRITSVYGTLESTPTDLGSVTPLEAFEVVLDNPEDEATLSTLTPTFQWQPSKTLISEEGTPVYHYGLYLDYRGEDPDKEILAAVDRPDNFYHFRTNTSEQISVEFTGNIENAEWDCLWKWYNGETDTYSDYESDELSNNSQYIWYVPLAYAVVDDDDSKAFSIASDFKKNESGWGIDPFGPLEPSSRNQFETPTE